MSKRILIVGATGLIGAEVVRRATGDVAILARREADWPSHVTAFTCPSADWPARVRAMHCDVLVNCLGTTWNAAGRSESGFRATDQHLVLDVAQAARDAGCAHMITVSAVGARARSGNFYLKVKGEVEDALSTMGFARLDIIRPGLLRGNRGGERRIGERLAILASPLTDLLTAVGGLRRYRSIAAVDVARAIIALTDNGAPGRFVREHDDLMALAGGVTRDGFGQSLLDDIRYGLRFRAAAQRAVDWTPFDVEGGKAIEADPFFGRFADAALAEAHVDGQRWIVMSRLWSGWPDPPAYCWFAMENGALWAAADFDAWPAAWGADPSSRAA